MEKKSSKAGANRLPNGRWAPGVSANANGRPPKPEIEELRQALAIVKKTRRKDFLIHFIERAYINDAVAIALAKKLLPDKIQGEGFSNAGTRIVVVYPKGYKKIEANENRTKAVPSRLPSVA